GMEKEIGSIEPGKRADMITVRIDRPHGVPLYDVYSQMVYALKGSDVRDVMVNGRMVVQDGHSLLLDERQILGQAGEFRRKISVSLKYPANCLSSGRLRYHKIRCAIPYPVCSSRESWCARASGPPLK